MFMNILLKDGPTKRLSIRLIQHQDYWDRAIPIRLNKIHVEIPIDHISFAEPLRCFQLDITAEWRYFSIFAVVGLRKLYYKIKAKVVVEVVYYPTFQSRSKCAP